MKTLNLVDEIIVQFLNENTDSNIWYHGSPDVRELEKEGGFTDRKKSITYISDINKYYEVQNEMKTARESGNDDEYFKLLDIAGKLQKDYLLKSPIFLTNKYDVAKTYADPNRSFDYQNAKEKVYKVNVNDGNNVKIDATGQRFRFIDVDNVKQGFINAGISENDFNKVFNMFNFYVRDKTKIKTDVIAAIGQWFKFDSIDVIGVLDSYNGGKIKSTVKMVFNPKSINIVK